MYKVNHTVVLVDEDSKHKITYRVCLLGREYIYCTKRSDAEREARRVHLENGRTGNIYFRPGHFWQKP